MKYQIIEKAIYGEADCLHFGDRYEMGIIINDQLPDYSGIALGEVVFESEDLEIVKAKKRQFEIKRLKVVGINPFFDDDELADKFYTSENFTQLKEFYETEFGLELVRINHNQMVVRNDDLYFPSEASEDQMMRIMKLVGLSFFEIKHEV